MYSDLYIYFLLMESEDGTVFATIILCIALVNFVGLNITIHYGAPTAIEDYFQEPGRAGRIIFKSPDVLVGQEP